MLWLIGIIVVGGLLIYFLGPDVGKDTVPPPDNPNDV